MTDRRPVPSQYKNATLDEFPFGADLLARVMAKGACPPVLITGSHGLGKTRACYALAEACEAAGKPVLFLVAPDYVTQLQALASTDMAALRVELTEVSEFWGLVTLDDLGAEKTTPFVLQSLYVILAAREKWGRPTVITTNLSQAELSEHLGERIASRISAGKIIRVK